MRGLLLEPIPEQGVQARAQPASGGHGHGRTPQPRRPQELPTRLAHRGGDVVARRERRAAAGLDDARAAGGEDLEALRAQHQLARDAGKLVEHGDALLHGDLAERLEQERDVKDAGGARRRDEAQELARVDRRRVGVQRRDILLRGAVRRLHPGYGDAAHGRAALGGDLRGGAAPAAAEVEHARALGDVPVQEAHGVLLCSGGRARGGVSARAIQQPLDLLRGQAVVQAERRAEERLGVVEVDVGVEGVQIELHVCCGFQRRPRCVASRRRGERHGEHEEQPNESCAPAGVHDRSCTADDSSH